MTLSWMPIEAEWGLAYVAEAGKLRVRVYKPNGHDRGYHYRVTPRFNPLLVIYDSATDKYCHGYRTPTAAKIAAALWEMRKRRAERNAMQVSP